MSAITEIRDGFRRLVTEINAAKSQRGDLLALSTADKTNIVAAINEVFTLAQSASGGGAAIDDVQTNSTTLTWSTNRIVTEISARISDLVGTAPAALDTLQELAAALQSNDSDISSILTDLGNRLRLDAPQTLTELQRQQGRDNLDVHSRTEIGDVAFDFVADIELNLS